jgi:spoIIIJ-associated protein
MTFREFTGKNVEEAIRTAMREFSADLGDLDIEILSQGARGILGVGGEEARILAAPKSAVAAAETLRAPSEQAPSEQADEEPPAPLDEGPPARDEPATAEPVVEPASEAPSGTAADETADVARAEERPRRRGGRGRGGRGRGDGRGDEPRPQVAPRGDEQRGDRPGREPAPFVPAKPLEELSEKERAVVDEAKSVLEELLRLMEVDASVEVAMGVETAKLNVRGGELGVLIGRRGEKLASLQHIVNLIVAKREGQSNRIAVDVENYRGRREEQLRDVAERAAKRVTQSGKIIQLEPMPALERRVVHLALRDSKKVRTQSVGVEPNRRVVILPASQQGS